MFSIGDFARFADVSVRTVRYYDEVGLLPPAAVDPTTGYRSYGADQLARLHRIVALKELGLSLEQLRPLLDDLDAAGLRGMLQLKRAELEDHVAQQQDRLARVERCLRAIEREGAVPPDVVLKGVPELRLAAVGGQAPVAGFGEAAESVTPAVVRLLAAIDHAELTPTGPMLIYFETVGDDTLRPFAAVPVSDGARASARFDEVVLPAVDVATTVYEGPPGHVEIGPVFAHLHTWIAEHGRDAGGPGRAVLLELPGVGASTLLELQLPLANA